ncbi:MAG: hypothetical protein AAF466_10105 [Bacteroidota bacterium]
MKKIFERFGNPAIGSLLICMLVVTNLNAQVTKGIKNSGLTPTFNKSSSSGKLSTNSSKTKTITKPSANSTGSTKMVDNWNTNTTSGNGTSNLPVRNSSLSNGNGSSNQLVSRNSKTVAPNNSRTKNKLNPVKEAVGDHTVFKRNNNNQVYKYETYNKGRNGNFDPRKRFDGGNPDGTPGKAHINKTTKKPVTTPHVQGKSVEGGVRKPQPKEIPKGN